MYLSHKQLIDGSARTIATAQRVAADRAFAVAESRRIYSGNLRGVWRSHQRYARLTLQRAAAEGLTVEKPYVIKTYTVGSRSWREVWGMLGNMPCPLYSVEVRP